MIIVKLCLYSIALLFLTQMRKFFAIIGALIGGGLGIAVLGAAAQVALARQTDN
jgi:hypothetical protein